MCTVEAGSHSIIFYPVFLKCSFSLTLFSGFCLFVLSVFLLAYLCLLSSSLVCLFILPVVHCSVLPCPLSIHKYSFLVFAFVLFFCLNYVHAALVTQSSIGADLLGGQILIVDVAQVRLCCHLFPPFFFLSVLSLLCFGGMLICFVLNCLLRLMVHGLKHQVLLFLLRQFLLVSKVNILL